MRVVYDSTKSAAERVQVISDKGETLNCGCFWLHVELTDMETGLPKENLEIKRWGSAAQRRVTHKNVVAQAKAEGKAVPHE